MPSYTYPKLVFHPQLICERMLVKVIFRHAGKKQRVSNNKSKDLLPEHVQQPFYGVHD